MVVQRIYHLYRVYMTMKCIHYERIIDFINFTIILIQEIFPLVWFNVI